MRVKRQAICDPQLADGETPIAGDFVEGIERRPPLAIPSGDIFCSRRVGLIHRLAKKIAEHLNRFEGARAFVAVAAAATMPSARSRSSRAESTKSTVRLIVNCVPCEIASSISRASTGSINSRSE